MVDLGIH